jgi:acyl-CoA reductase-like NAD-dependent aldehyde dehydrogenase
MISDEAWGPDGDLPIRRPHWDDDVIKAVADVLEHDDYIYATTYAVIAAVEDWQAQTASDTVRHLVARAERAEAERDRLANQLVNEVPDSYLQMKARALSAEAAIERVRDACERIRTDTYDLRPDSREALRAHERLAVAHLILRAIEGGAE